MRICHCVLGKNGKCCQDKSPTDELLPSLCSGFGTSSGQIYTYGMPRRVRKSRWGLSPELGGQPWIVTNHPAGTMAFKTWREAMDYASSPYVVMNMAVN